MCTFTDKRGEKEGTRRGQMYRRAEMLRRFLAEGIACHGTWSALRNVDGIRITRVAKGKGKHRRCRREMLFEGKPLGKYEPRTLKLGDRTKEGESS